MPPIIDQDHPEAEESRQGGDVDTVDITVLSPSPGVPDSFILRGVSLDTTVRELKLRLSTALDRHPAPAEQRLILRGRPLARDDDTVQAILQTEHQQQQQLLVGLGMAVFHYERQMRAGMPVSTEALTGLRDELRQRASTLQHVPVSRDHAADSAGARSQGQIADYFAGRVQAMIDSRVEAE
ncbi:hypothetical protein KEM52_004385 [Ascosphaera acerosa]|nr:hypothetical protein KEM52_004385 [Ascosphaera acerosa]